MRSRNFLASLALALAAAALYLPTLSADFVWDSRPQILTDTFIHDPRNIPAVLSLRVLGMDVLDFNRPVNLLSLMLDSLVWGKNPIGYHLTGLLLHAGVTALLFLLIVRLLDGAPNARVAAFLAALLFAVHPVNCEAVAEPSYREDLLVALFVLGGLNCAAWFEPGWLGGTATVLLFFLAAGAKESGVAGPVALGVYWFLFRRNEPRRAWLILIGATALAVGAFLAARFALEPAQSVIFLSKPNRLGGSLLDSLLIEARILTAYLRNLLWPSALCADYGLYSLRGIGLGLSLSVLICVAAGQVWISLRNRTFALGAVICWVALLPVSNIVPIFRPMADRFLYLPMTGVALMLAALGSNVRSARTMMAVTVILAVVLAMTTWSQEKIWHDPITLWTECARRNPQSYDAADNLASALMDAGRDAEVLALADKAIQLSRGKRADPFAIKAVAFESLGRTQDADAAFQKSVELSPDYRDPDSLVKSLIWEREPAEKLRAIAGRN